jgi:two-component system KDP operon response regulator KdpE
VVVVVIALKDENTRQQINQSLGICFTGCKTVNVFTGKECLRLIKQNPANIVILDSYLDDMEGIEVAKGIRCVSSAPILMLSYIRDQKQLVKAFEAGVNHYMAKPFHQMEFIARVRCLLRNYSCEHN